MLNPITVYMVSFMNRFQAMRGKPRTGQHIVSLLDTALVKVKFNYRMAQRKSGPKQQTLQETRYLMLYASERIGTLKFSRLSLGNSASLLHFLSTIKFP
jgi:hypothetical protein